MNATFRKPRFDFPSRRMSFAFTVRNNSSNRVVNWANNVGRGKDDHRESSAKAKFVIGGTIGQVPQKK